MESASQVLGSIGPGQERVKLAEDGEIAVMGKEGDLKTIWNPQNTDETEHARSTFNSMRAKGFLAFRVTEKGDQGEQITAFDATAGKMILVPPMAGG